jgi:predicted N-acetyltransferase YhbS
MNFKVLEKGSQEEIRTLFESVFTSSEGEREGRLIGNLASELSLRIDNQEVICLGTYEKGSLIGSIFFTQLRVSSDIPVFLLAPVAVSTRHQGKGVGTALIEYGLKVLRSRSVAVIITYGDPAFYTKVGFTSLSETVIQAPLKLSMPEGWLGQSLTEESIPPLQGRPECIRELNDPVYW